MRIIYLNRRKMLQLFIVFILVVMSIAYSKGLAPHFISVFINNDREIPIYSVEVPEKKVAISFDATWGDQYTRQLLDILDEKNIKTTFFLAGLWVDEYENDVKLIHQRGHEIGNHSTTHPHMSKLSDAQIREELSITTDKIKAITGEDVILFRPPFGDYNNRLIRVCRDEGYYVIQWDVDSLDWKELGVQPMVDRIKKNVREGSIILFHNNARYTAQALPIILDYLLDEGYKIVPISQLIYKENYYVDHEGRQHPLTVVE